MPPGQPVTAAPRASPNGSVRRLATARVSALSWLRAEQSGTWYVDGNGEIGGGGGAGAPREAFDAEGIRHFIDTIEEHNAAWQAWFSSSGIQPHPVRYEDLDADMAGTTHGILAHLGLDLPRGRRIVARHRRQADELTREWIERYRAETAGH
jgi:LPS sulfotransferase NodH